MAVITLKAVVSSLPSSWRRYARRYSRVTIKYTTWLKQAGLVDYFASDVVQQHRFLANQRMQYQEMAILDSRTVQQPLFVLLITDADSRELTKSLSSLMAMDGLNVSDIKLVLWGLEAHLPMALDQVEVDFSWLKLNTCAVSRLSDLPNSFSHRPVFFFREGERLHAKLLVVLGHWPLSNISYAYVDCNSVDDEGVHRQPEFMPDWNPDLQLTSGYVATGLWAKSLDDLFWRQVQGQKNVIRHFLMSVALSKVKASVEHISFCLLHKSRAERPLLADCPDILSQQILDKAAVTENDGFRLSLCWKLSSSPLVSLIIPTKNAWQLVKACIDSILTRSTYKCFEILLVDNNSDEQQSLEYFEEVSKHPKVRLLHYPGPFNYSAINNYAAKHCQGEVIGLVNNDVEVISDNWLTSMVAQVMRPEIGCVGAKLLYSDGRIQHAGVIMGYGGGAGHAHKFFAADAPGYMQRLVASHNVSAVTAACLLVKRVDFELVGGLNEVDLKVAFNDVDFCLKVRELGRRNLFCAEAVLFHHESVSRGAEDTPEKIKRFESEVLYLQKKWGAVIAHDPAYNRHLTLKQENFLVADQPEYRPFFSAQR
ncbi:glycosyltransferase family 2 protein [Bowmanella denitrificans]|uniref:glycosyltransferase family 2 protein n=1 Tax=Bowmanella denitrificans TaxID=366582 RepID=UPI001C0F09CE|nr:glycosyltransferase family 2 protein [Bowmanella denitrificans]